MRINTGPTACMELRGGARVSCSHTWRERLGDSSLRSPSAQVAVPSGHQLSPPSVHVVGALLTAATWAGSHPSHSCSISFLLGINGIVSCTGFYTECSVLPIFWFSFYPKWHPLSTKRMLYVTYIRDERIYNILVGNSVWRKQHWK
jgi:hypothetical protein